MSQDIGKIYDSQASDWLAFEARRFSWNYIEKPAFDRYISDLYRKDVRVLDVGCGSGRVIEHLIERGIDPRNIVGIEPSKKLLAEAKKKFRKVRFERCNLEQLTCTDESFDLVTSNMVFHYLDNAALAKGLDNIYNALAERGTLFFIAADADRDEETRKPENADKWLTQKSPWGTDIPVFNRDPRTLLTNLLDLAGFDFVSGWPLPVSEEGKCEPEMYARYKSHPSRIGARYVKTTEAVRDARRENKPIRSIY